ncbi:MAG: hypothetical protein EHM58_05200 [Ignavibacteriae bacterium]|nr:MAG: hypothetical protein EHM58_05200 [Ignavibacteriota bacterium]
MVIKYLTIVFLFIVSSHSYSQSTNPQYLFPVCNYINEDTSYEYFALEKWGYIDINGNVLIPYQFDGAGYFSEGLAVVRIGGLYGYINTSGQLVIPAIYREAHSFSEGLAGVSTGYKLGFIDTSGKLIIDTLYYEVSRFKFGLALAVDNKDGNQNEFYNYIDKNGNIITKKRYYYDIHFYFLGHPYTNFFNEGIAKVNYYGFVGYIDTSGKEIIIPQYGYKSDIFSEGLAKVEYNDKIGFIDKTGTMVITPQFGKDTRNFSEGLAAVEIDGKLGYIDKTGKLVIEAKWKRCDDFHCGLAKVFISTGKYTGDYGFINKNGEVVYEPEFSYSSEFSEGFAFIKQYSNNCLLLDSVGNLVKLFENMYLKYCSGFFNGLCIITTSFNDGSGENPENSAAEQEIYINKKGDVVWKSNPYYTCFPHDALVTMSDGSQKKISEITQNEKILSLDVNTGKYVDGIVLNTQYHSSSIYLIHRIGLNHSIPTSASGTNTDTDFILDATSNHPVMTSSGVVKVRDLHKGDVLICGFNKGSNSNKAVITSIEYNAYTANEVYNIRTSTGNYFVNGILVMDK